MATITVVGGTGYAGGSIAREAARRGHTVVSFSRTVPEGDARIDGVRYETGSMLDAEARDRAVTGSDVVVSALAPRGELDGRIVEADDALAALALERGVRLGVVGGFSSLRGAEGAPRFAETGDLPPEFASEALQMNEVLTHLLGSQDALDWFFVSPAMQFGSYAPGEALGRYRVGGEVALFDEAGVSAVSGADFALAVVDEIETPAHRRAQFGVAY
ncbi:N-acetyl-gamma-glutamyl-phosphate reductase [Frondihabitans sp. 762G35]|uniref:NAD(P)-dependent oxidoreductase n=1 Tax=Frondihabitans sp. 762G35 TaxID=1446794 RepID=UPI000D21BA70|nr:NAD(P)H-binding protein [Frondihabitans sp. 762G35]ARC58343.1 N-acetyl-gamma-glutamyl-phosphate reductase [Frondihabitans sp. 762G35]